MERQQICNKLTINNVISYIIIHTYIRQTWQQYDKKKKKRRGIRDNNNAAITINQEGNLRGTPIFFVIAIYSVSAWVLLYETISFLLRFSD